MLTRDDILKEIRQTAKNNGGIPLGAGRFKDKTGITQTDWGRYWPRFGDAQREAGFEANTLTPAYSDEYLFEKFILLTRELGKFPVQREITVKRNNDSEFPNRNVFLRLGTKQIFLTKLLNYAERKGYADVIKLCNVALEELSNHDSQDDVIKEDSIGSVYLLKSGRYYKVGRTNSMGRRHHEITIQLPEGVELIHEIRTDDPSGIETYWHKRFESKRKNGEWFDLNSSDVKAFRRWRRIT